MITLRMLWTRWAAVWHAGMDRLKQRHWSLWIIVLFFLFIAEQVVQSVLFSGTTRLGTLVLRAFEWLMGRPIGLFGLALFGLVVTLVLVSFIDTRPRRPIRTKGLPAPPPEERALIQDIRTVWNMHGCEAAEGLLFIFRTAVEEVKSTSYWGGLLAEKVAAFETANAALAKAVAHDSREPLADVRRRFDEMYAAFLIASRWLATLDKNKVIDLSAPQWHINEWRRSSKVFFYKLNELVQKPEHQQTLKIFLPTFVDDAAYAEFIRAAGIWKADVSLPEDEQTARMGPVTTDSRKASEAQNDTDS